MASSEAPGDGLLAQHRLLLAVIDTDWATRLDHKVAAVIIQRYYPKYGNARASLRFISEAVRADRSNVIDSTRRLVDRGPFSIVREGKGTRPTEYGLNFGFSASGGVPTTSSGSDPSGGVGTTSCGGVSTTASNPSGGVGTTESCLPVTGLHAELQERQNMDRPPPSAPPGMPLAGATGADVGKNERNAFDELWSAYGHKQKRADAKAAYEQLAPDADLHRVMVDAATAWQKHWSWQNNPDAPRKSLASWIRAQGYHEDPPKGYKVKERKAKATPANNNEPLGATPTKPTPDFTIHPNQRTMATIVRVEPCVDDEDGAYMISVWYQKTDGTECDQLIIIESPNAKEQERGQAELQHLQAVTDVNVTDGQEFVGCDVELEVTHKGEFVSVSKAWKPKVKESRPRVRLDDVMRSTPLPDWSSVSAAAKAYAESCED